MLPREIKGTYSCCRCLEVRGSGYCIREKNLHHLLGKTRENSMKKPFPGSSPAGIATLFFRWRDPQLPVDLVSLVRNRLSLRLEPLVFLVRSREAVATAEHSVPAEPIRVYGDLDIPIRRLRGRKLLHLISFGGLLWEGKCSLNRNEKSPPNLVRILLGNF